jgi:hypothetical protein
LLNTKAANPGVNFLGSSKRLDLSGSPKLVIDDGSLGFWVALQEEYGPITQQRLLTHKTANILDKIPKLKGFELIPKVVTAVDSCIDSIEGLKARGPAESSNLINERVNYAQITDVDFWEHAGRISNYNYNRTASGEILRGGRMEDLT